MSLIRSGVSRIRVIDYDIVTLSSLNRHAFALRSDVGKLKVRVVNDYASKINPSITIETIDDAFDMKYASAYLLKDIIGNSASIKADYIIDCIDDLDAKCDLLKFCNDNSLTVISSMGAGAKSDPTLIRVADFHFVTGDKLAKRLRANYKRRLGVAIPNFKTVFSIEKSTMGLTELEPHQKENPEEFRINENERIRSLPVFASVPAIFGQTLAAAVLCDLGGVTSEDHYNTVSVSIKEQKNKNIKITPNFEDEELMVGSIPVKKLYESFIKEHPNCELHYEDLEEVAKRFNLVSSVSKKAGNKINFFKWNCSKEASIDNLVLLSKSEINNHINLKDEESLIKFYGEEVFNYVASKLTEFKKK